MTERKQSTDDAIRAGHRDATRTINESLRNVELQVRDAPDPVTILSRRLDDMLTLPDAEAAQQLNTWMGALRRVEEVYTVSYGHRLVIIRHFEERDLWQHLIDPETELPFPTLTAWLSSGFIGCRRVNMEAHRDAQKLHDVPASHLLSVPKDNLKVLAQLSTQVRNKPDVLEAARTMDRDAFEEKVEIEHPQQHIERRTPMKFTPGRSWAKDIEGTIAYALEHDIAGTRDEALWKMAETARNQWELDEELEREGPAA